LVDFTNFWAAGYANLNHLNPYNLDNLFIGQQAAGMTVQAGLLEYYYLYPPWTFALFLPFNFINYYPAQLLWYLTNVIALMTSASILWRLYGGPIEKYRIAWVLGLTFAPALFVLYFGQVGPLLLLGICLFLLIVERDHPSHLRDFLAGCCLVLLTFKPTQLFLLWPLVLLWSIHKHRLGTILGLIASVIICMGISLTPNPNLLEQFIQFILAYRPTEWGVPTLGILLRRLIDINRTWLQFIPMVIGLGWVVWHWLRNKEHWNWLEQIPIILLASLLFTPYSWSHDQVVFLPAVMRVAVNLARLDRQVIAKLSLILWLGFNLFLFVAHLGREDALFYWQAPVFLGLYLLGIHYLAPEKINNKSQNKLFSGQS
jgi:hypothetical protein